MTPDDTRATGTTRVARHADEARRPRRSIDVPVLLGRMTLGLVPAIWAIGYATRPLWIHAPRVDGVPDHPLVHALFFLSMVIVPFTPLFVLPVGLPVLANPDPRTPLVVGTVLGRRRIDLRALRRIGALTIQGRGADSSHVVYLRDERRHRVLLWLGPDPRPPAPLRVALASAAAERPDIVSARARSMLRLGRRVPLGQRIALGTFSFVVGMAAYMAWLVVAFAAIVWVWLPL